MQINSNPHINKSFRLILYLIFPLSIIVDFINGYAQFMMHIHLPIGWLYRSAIMIILLYNLLKLRDNRWWGYLILVGVTFTLSMMYWLTEGLFSLSFELQPIIRIIYMLLMIVFFTVNMRKVFAADVVGWIANYGFLIACCITFSHLTGIGNHSYGENYGFGTKSFFAAGNDIGLTLVLSSVFSSMVLFRKKTVANLLKFLLVIVSCSFIGSRVGLFGALIVFSISCVYFVFFYHPLSAKEKKRKRVMVIMIVPMVCYGTYLFACYLFAMFDDYTLNRIAMDSIASARDGLQEAAMKHIKSLEGPSAILGKGQESLSKAIAHSTNVYAFTSQYKGAEADFHDLVGGYGFGGGLLILAPFIYFPLRSLFIFFHHRNMAQFWGVFVFSAFIAISYSAGHAIMNVMVAPIYGFSVIYFLTNRNKQETIV